MKKTVKLLDKANEVENAANEKQHAVFYAKIKLGGQGLDYVEDSQAIGQTQCSRERKYRECCERGTACSLE